MSESKEKEYGLGCFGCLLEIIGVIGICYICGCGWARGCVLRCVREIRGAWVGISPASQSPLPPPSCGEGLQPEASRQF